jgi:imidazolonepropionase-like amidohydrolase
LHYLGTVETGKLADVIVVKQHPLRDIANLRQIFDGRHP